MAPAVVRCFRSISNSFIFSRLPEELAERAGFEPAVRYKRTLTFQASAFNHSATSPYYNFQPTVTPRAGLIRACGPHPFGAHCVRPNSLRELVEPAVRYKRTLTFQASALTADILSAALRAAARFQIAPGDWVNHSATSPYYNFQPTVTSRAGFSLLNPF